MTEYERISLAVSIVNAFNVTMDTRLRAALMEKCLELLGEPPQKTTVEESA